MDKVCPLCNALIRVNKVCPQCNSELLDGGALQNYLGPYSPYMDADNIPLNMDKECCIHLLYCPNCSYDTRAAWNFIIV